MKKLILFAILVLAAGIAFADVNLEWDPNDEPDLAGYNVYRSLSPGSGHVKINANLINCPANDSTCTNYVDATAILGIRYYYVATAVNFSGNESGYSNEVESFQANPNAPDPPSNLREAGTQGANHFLEWDPVDGATSYVVMVGEDETGRFFPMGQTTKASYNLKLPPGQWRNGAFVAIKTVAANGRSELSDPIYLSTN